MIFLKSSMLKWKRITTAKNKKSLMHRDFIVPILKIDAQGISVGITISRRNLCQAPTKMFR